jgi:deoxyribodipyrimidine photo-lyase
MPGHMRHRVALVWFRRDLRLNDNAALHYARQHAACLVPVYLHALHELGTWAPGAASRWWLHYSLAALAAALRERGARLCIRRGDSHTVLRELAQQTRATLVCFNRLYDPPEQARDQRVVRTLESAGIEVQTFTGHLLLEPQSLHSLSGGPYRVYTPFARAVRARILPYPPLPAPRQLPGRKAVPSDRLDTLKLLPKTPWDGGLRATWTPGETGALAQLRALPDILTNYASDRDRPDRLGTSRLSPHLHFGEVSPRQVWIALHEAATSAAHVSGADVFARELLWREFAHHVLHHFPHTATQPLDPRFDGIPWARESRVRRAWQQGRTGIPIVDAGMRELWHTGFMHNRVRMIVASFLTKNARHAWQGGARWFWDTLVDADLANNTLNWQWVAGCGADAAPYFRIFNPVLQAKRFDPDGEYVRRYVPELARLPTRYLHEPWRAPAAVLTAAGVSLGQDYPRPVLDLAQTRAEALTLLRRHLRQRQSARTR